MGDVFLTRKGGTQKSEAKYAWRKYNGTPTKTFDCRMATARDLEVINTFGFDRGTINVNFFTGFSGGNITANGVTYDISFPSNGVLQLFTNGSNAGTCSITYNSSTGRINMGSWVVDTWSWNSGFHKDGDGVFIDFVINDNLNAYPKRGTQNGFHYEYVE